MTLSRREFFKYGAAAGAAGAATGLTGCVTALKHLSGAPDVTLDEGIPAGYEKVNLKEVAYSLSGHTHFKQEYCGKKVWFEGQTNRVNIHSVNNDGHHQYALNFWISDKNFYRVVWKAAHATDFEALFNSKMQDSGLVRVGGYVKNRGGMSPRGIFTPEFVIIDGNKISF